jgi:F-type H+-transporting ATPase subunit a
MITNYNPLEQFEVVSTIPGISGLTTILSITNIAIILSLGLAITLTGCRIMSYSDSLLPTRWSIALETLIISLVGMVKDQLGHQKEKLIYFPLMISLFIFILLSNLVGMIPYSFTPTTHITVTIGFSIAIMIGVTIIGLENFKTDFFSLFVPSGTPIALVPLLTLIEFISYTARSFSLALRLSVNVTAGHSLFGVISMLSYSAMGTTHSLLGKILIFTLPLLILIPLYGLELLVAILQAYVFTLLTISYLKDVISIGEGH